MFSFILAHIVELLSNISTMGYIMKYKDKLSISARKYLLIYVYCIILYDKGLATKKKNTFFEALKKIRKIL